MNLKLLLSLLWMALPLSASAQRVLIKAATNEPCCVNGWPIEWLPVSYTNTPAGWTTNVTTAQALTYRANLQAAQDARLAEVINSSQTNRQAQLQALAALFNNFETYDVAWKNGSNFNAGQLQTILRDHNEALVRMRPILREIYESR